MPATVIGRLSRLFTGHRVRGLIRGWNRWTFVRLGIVAAAIGAAIWAVYEYGRPYDFFDLRIYHGAVTWWWGGGDLYEYIAPDITLGFTYPPFSAIVMLPMAVFSSHTAGVINMLAGLVVLTGILAAILVPLADRYGWPRWFAVALAVPLAAATEPVRESLGFGQVNMLLFGLIVADLVALRWRHRASLYRDTAGADKDRARDRPVRDRLRRLWLDGSWAGVGIGLASAVKLTPALFIIYLLVTKQWRAAGTAIATAVGVTFGAFLIASRESFTYFTSVVWDTNRVGVADMTPNQSLAGVLARLYDSATTPGLMWLAFAMLMLAVGLSRAATAHNEGDELAAFTLVGLTANVITPISWSHHLVFVLPAIVILADSALRRRSATRALSGLGAGSGAGGGVRLSWFPPLAGLRYAVLALGVYVLFVVSPIWPYEHQFPRVSHYADGLTGVLAENSLALAIIALVAIMPWRTGAEPAFYVEPALRAAAARSRPTYAQIAGN